MITVTLHRDLGLEEREWPDGNSFSENDGVVTIWKEDETRLERLALYPLSLVVAVENRCNGKP